RFHDGGKRNAVGHLHRFIPWPRRQRRLEYADVDMMHSLTIARQNLGGSNPFAFGEVCRNGEVHVPVLARRHHEILSNIDYEVRLAELPSIGEYRWSGKLVRV